MMTIKSEIVRRRNEEKLSKVNFRPQLFLLILFTSAFLSCDEVGRRHSTVPLINGACFHYCYLEGEGSVQSIGSRKKTLHVHMMSENYIMLDYWIFPSTEYSKLRDLYNSINAENNFSNKYIDHGTRSLMIIAQQSGAKSMTAWRIRESLVVIEHLVIGRESGYSREMINKMINDKLSFICQ